MGSAPCRSRRCPRLHLPRSTRLPAPFLCVSDPLKPLLTAIAVIALIGAVRWPASGDRDRHRTAAIVAQAQSISGMSLPDGGLEHAMSLLRTWETLYGLSADSPLPPSAISLPPSIPPAPHLEPCSARSGFRLAAERRGKGGALPQWAQGDAACGNIPQPPWVRGSDSSNLAATRTAQRDLWALQFPPPSGSTAPSEGAAAADGGDDEASAAAACDGRKLLLVRWPDVAGTSSSSSSSGGSSGGNSSGGGVSFESLAGQLHAMSVALSVAVTANRVLVPMPGTFQPANNSHCQVSRACEAAAMQQYRAAGSPPCSTALYLLSPQQLLSNDTLLCAVASTDGPIFTPLPDSARARAWADAYKRRPFLVEHRGALVNISEQQLQAHWWQSQSLRFLLRWPSPYLCHALNRARNTALGLQIATRATAFQAEQRVIVATLSKPQSEADQGLGLDLRNEGKLLLRMNLSKHRNLETDAWPSLGFSGCLPLGKKGYRSSALGTEGTPLEMFGGAGAEAYLLRPIVSIHVAESLAGEGSSSSRSISTSSSSSRSSSSTASGDAAGASSLSVPLVSALLLSYQLRRREPGLKYVWLSTDQQEIVNQVSRFLDWTFLFPKPPPSADPSSPASDLLAAALADLLIASESDYFVGALTSTWSRVIYELKSTNGRLYAGFLSIDTWNVN